MDDREPPKRARRRVKGPPYFLVLVGLALVFLGLRLSSKATMAVGAGVFGLALLIGYARAPSRPPRPPG